VWGPLGKYTVGGYPWAVAIADLSGDGKADLVASNDGPWVSVLLGDGAGGFAARTDYGSRGGAQSLAVADYDADGRPDVALTGPDSVQILLGDGRGGLGPAFLHASGTGPVSVATADLDADGRLDLATANYNSGSVSVLRGRIPTVVSLNVNVATVPLGAVVLLLADVSITPPATGTATSLIRFFDGFTLLGEAPLGNGHAELMINMQHLGDRPLTAVYVGDDRRFGSISPVRIVHVVDPALIDVPSSTGPIALALEGVRPNPSPAGRITVSLALPNDAPARLELVDVRGRIVATREVGTLGAGSHTIALTPQRRPAPGVYFVRLCQGEVRRAMRVALL